MRLSCPAEFNAESLDADFVEFLAAIKVKIFKALYCRHAIYGKLRELAGFQSAVLGQGQIRFRIHQVRRCMCISTATA